MNFRAPQLICKKKSLILEFCEIFLVFSSNKVILIYISTHKKEIFKLKGLCDTFHCFLKTKVLRKRDYINTKIS